MKHLLDRIGDKFTVGDGCWEWVGAHNTKGYGVVPKGAASTMAHRVIYELVVGPIPAGLELDHLCRNRGCVRPCHLEPVTHAENVRRGQTGKINHRNAVKTHCPQGHAYDEENTYIHRRGDRVGRECRICRNALQRAGWKRRRGGWFS